MPVTTTLTPVLSNPVVGTTTDLPASNTMFVFSSTAATASGAASSKASSPSNVPSVSSGIAKSTV